MVIVAWSTWKYPSELLLPSEKVRRPWPQILPARNSDDNDVFDDIIILGTYLLHISSHRWWWIVHDHGTSPVESLLWKSNPNHPFNGGVFLHHDHNQWPWNQPCRKLTLNAMHIAHCTRCSEVRSLYLHEFALITWAIRKSHHLKMLFYRQQPIFDSYYPNAVRESFAEGAIISCTTWKLENF